MAALKNHDVTTENHSSPVSQDGLAIDSSGVLPAVEGINVTRRFGTVEALAGVSVTIRRGEFFSILGPSGCGKTTFLRLVAGLDVQDEGTIRIGGVDMMDIPAHRRPVNTVFQSYALFPHMNVSDNIGFGLRMKKTARSDIRTRVDRVMDVVQITELAHRKPAQLSGGQKQRVALARAIVNEPQVLLLDEPLAALDLKLRKALEVELMELQRRLGITFIFVTHDQEEALVMSDRLAVMNNGKIEQVGDVESVYEHPRTRFVGQFLGSCNLIEGTVEKRWPSGAIVKTCLGSLSVDFKGQRPDAFQRDRFTLAIRPEKVNLFAPTEAEGENRVKVRVREQIYVGSETHYLLEAGGLALTAEVMNTKVGSQGFDNGQPAVVYLSPAGLIVLDD